MKIGSYEISVPFVTTSSDNLKTVLDLSEINAGQKIADLGSGDGRVVLEFAKALRQSTGEKGGIVHGFEIKPELVHRSRQRITNACLTDTVIIYEKNFWDADLSQYDLVYIYGMQSILGKLERKLEKELKPGAKFISNIFRLPHWKIKKTVNSVHQYINSG